MLPQRAAVAFVLAKVAVNGAVMECDPVMFMQVGTYLFGAEFAADKGVDVLNQLRIKLIGFSLTLFGQPALPLGFIGAVLLPLDAVPLDFSADGAFVAVELFGDFGDGAVAGQVLDMVSFVLGQLCVAHGNLSCRTGRMLPHTGLFLLWKVALQMRIRRRLKINETVFQTTFLLTSFSLSILGHHLTFTTHTVCRINPFLRGFHLILQTFNPFLIAGVVSLVAITDLFALFQIFLCLSQFVLR